MKKNFMMKMQEIKLEAQMNFMDSIGDLQLTILYKFNVINSQIKDKIDSGDIIFFKYNC